MTPRPDLVNNGYCLAEEGKQYLIYLEEPGSVDVDLPRGEYDVQWINARQAEDRRQEEITSDGQGLETPPGGDDWLLYIVAQRAGINTVTKQK